jgi:hypothetical protein
MGLPLVEVKMDPIKSEEVVHDRYHHGRVIGDVDPNQLSFASNQGCLMLPAPSIIPAEGLRMVGFTKGHTSYEWTEPKP